MAGGTACVVSGAIAAGVKTPIGRPRRPDDNGISTVYKGRVGIVLGSSGWRA
jgi:hypothetical protein